MGKEAVSSPVRTPLSVQGTPSTLYAAYNSKLWDERPSRYAKNVFKHVCVALLVLTTCNQIANFALSQSLKNFFQKLGWSNKGSNSMKLTYNSLTQFSCIIAGYIADEHLGKFKTLLSAASLDSVGLLLVVVAALPSVLAHRSVSRIIFNVGLFGGVALSQVCLRALVVSYGGDQFSPLDTSGEKSVFFGYQYWSANIAAVIGFGVFPSVSANGVGAIPAEYGYFFVYVIALAVIVAFVAMLYATRGRYVNVPPRRSSITVVINVIVTHAKTNFRARMIVLGTSLYIAAFLLNIVASFLADYGSVGKHIAYVCGVLILLATVLWVYFGRDSSFLDSAKDTAGGAFDSELVDGVKKVIRILPFNAFNVFFWCCQSQSSNNQSIVQQTDVRVGDSLDAYQIPGPTIQMFNPILILVLVPLTQKVIYPYYEKRVGKKPSPFGKVFLGYVIIIIAVVWTGTYEVIRRSASPLTYIGADGEIEYILNDDGGQVMNDISWATTIPQYLLIASGEVFTAITSYDINYSEVPASMRGTSIALGFFVNSMGSTLMSVFVQLFGKYITSDLNDGHFEYMYYTISAVMVLNLIVFTFVMNQMQLGTLPPVTKNDDTSAAKADLDKEANES
jgi:peptide/histidine transporter 3/4